MRIEVQGVAPEELDADVLAVPLAEGEGLTGAAADLDVPLRGLLAQLREAGELRADAGGVRIVHVAGQVRARRVAAAGIGELGDFDADVLRTAAAAVANEAGEYAHTVGWVLDSSLPLAEDEQARALVEGAILGGYDSARWKHNGSKPKLDRLVLCGDERVADTARRAATVADWTNRARDLVNSPPNEATPERLAARAAEIAASVAHVESEALGPEEIRGLGMGALAAVAQGSDNPPRLVVMRYEPPAPANRDVVLGLVGKAITFDTGGISLKPSLHMEDMKGDMAGGAAVLEATGAIAELGIPLRVLTVAAATENMPSGHAYRPGDIITAANGKTIEVTNTDAEGRLVLADALWYARGQGATHILDLATLTGAMEVALGDLYAGLFANEDEWRDRVVAAGEASGDHAWAFPMHPRYRRFVDSVFADMKNSSEYRQAGAILAAEFLKAFAGEGPWAHADIAGPAFLERSRGDYMHQRGGTGYGVRLIAELAELGLMGMPIPEEYGGAGTDTLSYAIAVEELTRVDSSVAITMAAHTSLGTMPILLFGTEEQKRQWLPDLASGKKLAAFGLTEPGAGSDAGATRTTAELRDGSWIINGSKIFITNAGTEISACVTITARTGTDEISNIIVPNGTPGYVVSKPMKKLGWHASDTRELSFENCAVPEDNLLGPRGRGYQQFLEILDGGRISVAAMGVGLAQGAYDLAYAYARERQQFGKPIAAFQAVQFQLADMATEIEAGRTMVYRAAWMKDQGRPFGKEAAIAKLYTGEMSHRVVDWALQIHGGYGFMDEFAISRFYRDQKILEIGEGTNEVQRMVIAKHLGF